MNSVMRRKNLMGIITEIILENSPGKKGPECLDQTIHGVPSTKKWVGERLRHIIMKFQKTKVMDIIFKAPREKKSYTKVQPLWNLETASRASEILRKSYFQLRIPYLTKEKVHLRICKNPKLYLPCLCAFSGSYWRPCWTRPRRSRRR